MSWFYVADGKPFKPANIKKIDEPIGDDRAIFGLDNRHPMLSRDYPWAAIGRIEAVKADGKTDYHCTGSLITEDIVLANAHCVVDPYTYKVSKEIKFRPNVINGRSKDDNDTAVVKKIIAGTNFKESPNVKYANTDRCLGFIKAQNSRRSQPYWIECK